MKDKKKIHPKNQSMTRRGFLSRSSISIAGLALAGVGMKSETIPAVEKTPSTQMIRSYCSQCYNNCPVVVRIKDGIFMKVKPDREHPF